MTLATADGAVVRAKHVVFTTGYELVKLVKSRGHQVISTWAMATAPQPDKIWPSRCLIWEASDPYLYLRTTLDGRVICGGEDEEFSDEKKRDALIPEKIAAISRKLGKLMPHLNTQPAFAWAGCFGSTPTGLPMIGAIPGRRAASQSWATAATASLQRGRGADHPARDHRPARSGCGSVRVH